MSKIKVADFYYGAVLSMLFNRKVNPVLVESDNARQIYDLTTNNGSCRLYTKYRGDKQKIKSKDYSSWYFVFSEQEIIELNYYIDEGFNLSMALVCGVEGLSDSEIAVLNNDEIVKLLELDKKTITISRRKNERAYRISVGGDRDAAMQIKSNQFEEIFI